MQASFTLTYKFEHVFKLAFFAYFEIENSKLKSLHDLLFVREILIFSPEVLQQLHLLMNTRIFL